MHVLHTSDLGVCLPACLSVRLSVLLSVAPGEQQTHKYCTFGSQCSHAQATGSGCTAQDSRASAEYVQSLETHLKQTSAQVLTELTLLSTLAAFCCRQHKHHQPSASDILTALLQIQINGLAVVPVQHTDAKDRIALALYPTASLMNHSCHPNVALAFDGALLTARAVEPLQSGDTVLHCYGPQKGLLITPLRQQQLQEQYHFLCQCRACKGGFDLAEQASVGLQCLDTSCDGVVVPKWAVVAGICSLTALPSNTGSGCCSRCTPPPPPPAPPFLPLCLSHPDTAELCSSC